MDRQKCCSLQAAAWASLEYVNSSNLQQHAHTSVSASLAIVPYANLALCLRCVYLRSAVVGDVAVLPANRGASSSLPHPPDVLRAKGGRLRCVCCIGRAKSDATGSVSTPLPSPPVSALHHQTTHIQIDGLSAPAPVEGARSGEWLPT